MKVKYWLIGAGVLVVLLLVLTGLLSGFITDLWWFGELGYESVFWTSYKAQYFLWFAGFLFTLAFFFFNVRHLARLPGKRFDDPRIQEVVDTVDRFIPLAAKVVAVILGIFMAGGLGSTWKEALVYLNAEAFGLKDPVFGHDLGFYLFSLPFIQAVRQWLMTLTAFTLVGVLALGFLKQKIRFDGGPPEFEAGIRRHAGVLGAVFLGLMAWGYWLGRYDILNSTRSGSFYGAGYTDVHAQLPMTTALALITALAAVGAVALGFDLIRKKGVIVLGGLFLLAHLVSVIYPSIIQKFVVDPMEQSKETNYIRHNLEFTRRAYDLDKIEEKAFVPKGDLTAEDVRIDTPTMKNVMLWDYRPLASTLDQLQVIRLYYNFPDVDIDRYRLPSGDYRQVMLAARELDQGKLPGNAATWVNLKFVYTHGYGVTMSPVNVVTKEGLPEFFLKDIPPVSTAGLKVDRPEIYFGEKTDNAVIVRGANIQEFDYPVGDSNQFTTYRENAGVSIGSFFRRLIFAIDQADINILFSGYIAPGSRILYHRNIKERVRRIAPFLQYDDDPYLVAEDGRLYWICDAYTTCEGYPYAKPFAGRVNYIRNSVKVVIDAYNGKTDFYLINEANDPVVRLYARIYPALFKPLAKMPETLRRHLRYPQDLFDIQAAILEAYHMEDPNVFYNKEDLWNIANEKATDKVTRMESYHAMIRLPDAEREEFILMVPYTPNKRDNMIAWLCARSDGEHYGKMRVYKFPKQALTYGPMQVSARIDQDPVISQQLTLWNQQGSSVSRGNLLVIPVRDDVVYIQPIYLQATSGKLPELKRVIVTYGNRVSMETTLEEALNKVFGGAAPAAAASAPPAGPAGTPAATPPPSAPPTGPAAEVAALARAARERYDRAQDFLRQGNWARYGEEMDGLRKQLEELVEAAGGKGSK
ncbi:MAG: UPF0182 family protein [Acidobacteria bacterium]|nr:UPF0182 family protein [Acidobacteriota bacterium]